MTTIDSRVYQPGADRGVVFQQPTRMPCLAVIDNVAFHRKLTGVGRAGRRARAQEFVDFVGLTGFDAKRRIPALIREQATAVRRAA